MNARRTEAILNQLIPMETYRVPLVPTRQFGRPALLGTVTGLGRATRGSDEPLFWYALDIGADALVVFARAGSVWPPAAEGERPDATARSTTMHPRDAQVVLRETRPVVVEAFVDDRPIARDLAEQVAAAYNATIPTELSPWLTACCRDFFDWLARSRAH